MYLREAVIVLRFHVNVFFAAIAEFIVTVWGRAAVGKDEVCTEILDDLFEFQSFDNADRGKQRDSNENKPPHSDNYVRCAIYGFAIMLK